MPPLKTFLGNTMEAQRCTLTCYETATAQVDDLTNRAAIIQQVMGLAQNTIINRVTETGKRTPVDPSGDTGMDANTDSGLNKDGTGLVGTNLQTSIHHATTTTTTEEPHVKGITIPINVDTLEPGSPESPIYIDALKYPPSPNSQRSNSPDILIGPITHTQLCLSMPKGDETPFCCHADGTPSNLMKLEVITGSPATSLHWTSHLDLCKMMDLTLSLSPSQTLMESPNTPTTST